jgi:ribosomal protein L40E
MDAIEFTRNYTDHSTDRGFQFEFHCDRCGNGYKTAFQAWTMGTVSGALDAASSLFGGVFGEAANLSERARSATWQQARDKAMIDAVAQVKPNFLQCPHCLHWVCKRNCWNQQRGLCKECAPDLAVEISAQQSAKALEQIQTGVGADADDEKLIGSVGKTKVAASCPNCHAPLASNAKFCPSCGFKLADAASLCKNCGSKLSPGAKFCPECGTKQ